MAAQSDRRMIAHLVGSVPLADAQTVFRRLSASIGTHLLRMPDGETGIRQSWIRFLQDALANHPAIEIADDVPPFRFVQWDGQLVREIPRLRVRQGATIGPAAFASGYAKMAIESWRDFSRLQEAGLISSQIKFQISLPSPIAPTYNNIVPSQRHIILPPLTQHFVDQVDAIAHSLPAHRIAIQWDVCQEVLAWEGYYEPGPVDFREQTIEVLARIGDAVPAAVEMGFHLCYGSPLDAHIVQPKDTGVMVEMIRSITSRIARPIQFFHLPVPKPRTDDAYFAPLEELHLPEHTDLYLGLVHYEDGKGDRARLQAARRYARVDGIATECGMGRGDPAKLDALLRSHRTLLENDPM